MIVELIHFSGKKADRVIDEVRSKVDIEDTQFNEAFNRLAEKDKIVPRGGKWVHRENILGGLEMDTAAKIYEKRSNCSSA